LCSAFAFCEIFGFSNALLVDLRETTHNRTQVYHLCLESFQVVHLCLGDPLHANPKISQKAKAEHKFFAVSRENLGLKELEVALKKSIDLQRAALEKARAVEEVRLSRAISYTRSATNARDIPAVHVDHLPHCTWQSNQEKELTLMRTTVYKYEAELQSLQNVFGSIRFVLWGSVLDTVNHQGCARVQQTYSRRARRADTSTKGKTERGEESGQDGREQGSCDCIRLWLEERAVQTRAKDLVFESDTACWTPEKSLWSELGLAMPQICIRLWLEERARSIDGPLAHQRHLWHR
jgi:hypothetical protein